MAGRGTGRRRLTPTPARLSHLPTTALLLDDTSCNRQTLEVLRQPLEDGTVTRSRGIQPARRFRRTSYSVAGAQPLPLRISRRFAANMQLYAADDRSVHEQDFRPSDGSNRHSRIKIRPSRFASYRAGRLARQALTCAGGEMPTTASSGRV
jgi:hypothetical protein